MQPEKTQVQRKQRLHNAMYPENRLAVEQRFVDKSSPPPNTVVKIFLHYPGKYSIFSIKENIFHSQTSMFTNIISSGEDLMMVNITPVSAPRSHSIDY